MYLLQTTRLTYANEYAQAIRDRMKLQNTNLFLKYKNKIVYIKVLNPFLEQAKNISIIYFSKGKVYKLLFSSKATYHDNKWFSSKIKIIFLKKNKWFEIEKRNVSFLNNFQPKIISNLEKLNNISISFYDAYLTIRYFKKINLNKIFSVIFFYIFTPLSMISVLIYLFLSSPIHIRISNYFLFLIKGVFFSVMVWSVSLILFKFARENVISYYFLVTPFLAMIILNFYVLRRKNEF
jgi:lipopolysaccharide export system permease protein